MATKSKKEDYLKRTVFAIKPPEDQDSRYFLLVTRGSSPFGGGGSAAFAVDGVYVQNDTSGKGYSIRGFRNRGAGDANATVVEFGISSSFILVERATIKLMTPEESAAEQLEEETRLDALVASKPVEAKVAKTVPSGQYL